MLIDCLYNYIATSLCFYGAGFYSRCRVSSILTNLRQLMQVTTLLFGYSEPGYLFLWWLYSIINPGYGRLCPSNFPGLGLIPSYLRTSKACGGTVCASSTYVSTNILSKQWVTWDCAWLWDFTEFVWFYNSLHEVSHYENTKNDKNKKVL